jgi:hypothetical protein
MSDAAIAAIPPAQQPATHSTAWKDPKGFGFHDLLDIINPLQHLPIIGSIYRWATGDRPGEAAQIAGDAIYGGPIGIAFGLVSAATEDAQGHDLGERALAAMFGPDQKTTAVAAATPPAAAAMPAAPAAAASPPQAKPDHPPMPLFGGIALPPPSAPAAAPAAQDGAARDFLAHNAMLERQISAGSRGAPATSPIPLVLPPGSLTPPRATAAASSGSLGGPIDISHKMLDALDKYMRLEQERKTHPMPPDEGPPASVDLSL